MYDSSSRFNVPSFSILSIWNANYTINIYTCVFVWSWHKNPADTSTVRLENTTMLYVKWYDDRVTRNIVTSLPFLLEKIVTLFADVGDKSRGESTYVSSRIFASTLIYSFARNIGVRFLSRFVYLIYWFVHVTYSPVQFLSKNGKLYRKRIIIFYAGRNAGRLRLNIIQIVSLYIQELHFFRVNRTK